MFIILYLSLVLSVQYSVVNNVLTISGSGSITMSGVRSKGDYSKLTQVIIEEGPQSIGDASFMWCQSLTSIQIPKSVTSITSPFYGCSSLSSIIVDPKNPNFVSDEEGFLYSKNYEELYRAPCRKSISIREGVKTLKHYSFAMGNGYSYDNITLPNSLENIESEPFYGFIAGKVLFRETPLLQSMKGFAYSSISQMTIPKSCTSIETNGIRHTTVGSFVFQYHHTCHLHLLSNKTYY